MTHTDVAVQVQNLSKRFGDHAVLDGLDLHVDYGEIVALLGANGAGKTTLIRILSTLLRPDSGHALVAGHDVSRESRAVRSSIALTGQYAAVDEQLTGRENLQLIARLLGLERRPARRRVGELLDRFALRDAADRRVATYSGGMRRRLDLAASLVIRPVVLFLDEPTTGLDPTSREALWEDVRSVAAEGSAVLLTTQYLEEADRLADRVCVLRDGRIVADAPPEQLKATVGRPRLLVTDPATGVVSELATSATAGDLSAALHGLPAASQVALREPTLDDVFANLTRGVRR